MAENDSEFFNLQIINFGKNKITEKGFIIFVKNSQNLRNLQKIDFSWNKITDTGIKLMIEYC